jgi:arginine N-succinyltransferase
MMYPDNFCIRLPKPSDAPVMYRFSTMAKRGLTNVPKTMASAETLIQKAQDSVHGVYPISNRLFTFVLEDLDAQAVVGMAGIKARTGIDRPVYAYIYHQNGPFPHLELSKTWHGPSELGGLFLSPNYRRFGIGRLLSLSRLLFVQRHRSVFTPIIGAELRGFLFKNNVSPFWNALGRQFIKKPFSYTERLVAMSVDDFEKRFPQKPVYTHLLPSRSVSYLQQVHPFTVGAKKMLEGEGFSITNRVDIFDGGPRVQAVTDRIRTVQYARSCRIVDLPSMDDPYIVCNHHTTDFRATRVLPGTSWATIAQRLGISNTDTVTWVKERP